MRLQGGDPQLTLTLPRSTAIVRKMVVDRRFMLLEQAVADQQRDTTFADLDRCDHGDAPGAALAEASCTDGGCRFMFHLTD
ncbi:hypothetical protein OAJ57_02010 [Alphaproteobacteria bacterium]|nr:hypothetical protein [Alphaproteobacteria bacterium]